MDKPKKQTWLTILRYLGLLIGFGLLLSQIYNAKTDLLFYFQESLHNPLFLVSLLIIIFAIVVQISIWHLIVHFFYVHIPYRESLLGYTLSFLPKYIPGSFWGYLSRNEWLFHDFGIQRKTSTLISGVELFFISGSILFIFGFYLLPGKPWIHLVIFLLILGAELILLSLFQKRRLIPRFASDDLKPVGFWKVLIVNMANLLVWLLYGFALLFLVTKNPFELPLSSAIQKIVQYSVYFGVAWFIGFAVFFVPSGLGIREQSLATLLQKSGNLPLTEAIQISLVFRILISIAELILAVIGIIYRITNRSGQANKF